MARFECHVIEPAHPDTIDRGQDTAMMKVYIDTMNEEINAMREGLEQQGVQFDSNGVPIEA